MRPDDSRNQNPIVPERQTLRASNGRPQEATSQAAASIVRDQIDSIYERTATSGAEQTSSSAYERTHSTHQQIQTDQWTKYHSAWQDYYQKYYERYYVGQVYQAKQALEAKARQAAATQEMPTTPAVPVSSEAETLSREEALYDLRTNIREKVRSSSVKLRKSRHFMPIAAAACVMLLFLFLQYNRVLFANVEAYISPGSVNPANIIVDPLTEIAVGPEPKLIIPKINVDVPVVYNVTPDNASQLKAMERGVAWFGIPGANSKPGQVGNTVLSGHSSNDVFDKGDYKFIFARLEQMQKGDTIYINHEGKRYAYSVTRKEVVKPTQVEKLIYETDKPVLTLITCTPLGTTLNRLLVTAEQVSPNPKEATPAPATEDNPQSAAIPGNTSSFLEKIFR